MLAEVSDDVAERLSWDAVGVKIAERVKPVPSIALRVPPVTIKSPSVPSQIKLEPGSSVKVKVTVAVSLILKVETLEETTTSGKVVSIKKLGLLMTGLEEIKL